MSLAHKMLKSPRAIDGEIVDRDAIGIGELYEQARTSIVDSVRCQIECGQRLAAKKASLKHGEWLPWLEGNAGVLGFSTRRTASMLMKAAGTNGKSTSHLDEADAAKISRLTWGNNNVRGKPRRKRPAPKPTLPKPVSFDSAFDPVDLCTMHVRATIFATLQELPPTRHEELFERVRGDLDDLETKQGR